MQESTSSAVRRLVVMRHSKAEATGPSDRERALAPRGRADAAEAGRWLREQGVDPDAALVSDALRTQETWAAVADGAGWDLEPELSSALYAAGPDAAIDLLRETDPATTTLLVIGHNPTMAYVAELLDDGDGDADATTALITRGFPTSGLAVFTLGGDWTTVGPGTCRLTSFHVGDG
ncbi:histidine phosphatase family protein [Microbacterium sp. ARD31]|uniref:SixA phosphatase family protein n=1 Tax=Microbacterium sp. ARD31 TaxID=2962576 RepID=UPI002881E908|nr:histidine phosphatase family protein [Microbacterium sp. ARD31]MDT0185685.1 histidine phosphatase family protein [Microbacterium sp. ARD31]